MSSTIGKKEGIGWIRYSFYGLNVIFGLTFLVSMGSVYRSSGDWMFLLFALGAVLIFLVGSIYAYLGRELPNAKGGIYAIVKRAFGYRSAFFFNWCQYIVSPTILVGETLSVVLAFSGLSWYSEYYWLIVIISVVLFMGLSVLLTFGFHSTRIMIIALTIISYISIGFFLFSALAKFGGGFFPNLVGSSTNGLVHFTFAGCITSFFTFFFALGGIEFLASSSEELKDKKGGVIKAIVFVMLFSLGGYLLLTLAIKGVLGANGLSQTSQDLAANPLNRFWFAIYGGAGGVIIIYIFAGIKVLSESNARLNLGWLSARIIEPMAEDGFLPSSWAHRNKHNQLSKAIVYHSLLTFGLLAAILVPLILYKNASQTIAAPFQIYSVIAFVQFIGVAAALIVLMRRNVVKRNALLPFSYMLVIILASLLILYVYSAITQALQGDTSQWIALGSSAGAIFLALPAYLLGSITGIHKKGWKSERIIAVEHAKLTEPENYYPYDSK